MLLTVTSPSPGYRPDRGDKTNIQTCRNCLLLGLEITRNCSKLRLNWSEWQQQHLLMEVFSISTTSAPTPSLPTTSSPPPPVGFIFTRLASMQQMPRVFILYDTESSSYTVGCILSMYCVYLGNDVPTVAPRLVLLTDTLSQ